MAGLLRTTAAGQQPEHHPQKEPAPPDVGVSPAEDLMREHGVLNRILLIYEESGWRLAKEIPLDPRSLLGAARIVRRFIEDYHAKLEEDHIFPRFEKAGKLVDLVKVLRQQHQAGRQLTDQILVITERILQTAPPTEIKDARGTRGLRNCLHQFIRMYRPHEAREDTVLFPAIRTLVTPGEFDDLGEQFEEKEHELFGEHGFEDVVDEVARLEKTLGLDDLSKFTARP